jgi:fructose-1,6-bisphosphatase/sedoheptulose 1,7-bisphosphatase-like protein
MGGEFQGRLQFRNEEERARAVAMGMQDPDRLLRVHDLVRGDVLFVATGVTSGPLLKGVRRIGTRLHLQSLALRSATGTIRWVNTDVDAHRYSHEYDPA